MFVSWVSFDLEKVCIMILFFKALHIAISLMFIAKCSLYFHVYYGTSNSNSASPPAPGNSTKLCYIYPLAISRLKIPRNHHMISYNIYYFTVTKKGHSGQIQSVQNKCSQIYYKCFTICLFL